MIGATAAWIIVAAAARVRVELDGENIVAVGGRGNMVLVALSNVNFVTLRRPAAPAGVLRL
jgi:hypothetical protein